MNIIETNDLVYEYTKFDENGDPASTYRALDGVNLTIEQGSFVAILGHNGSGKSTFAKHLNALYLPTGGKVLVEGMDTTSDENLWEIRQTTGMVFQNPDNQIIGNVVEEDVAFGPENMGIETQEILKRVNKALECVGMEAFRDKSPMNLSGGQKQRVAIAGILAMQPKCIVLDEPTAMLDPDGRKDVIRTLHELNKNNGMTICLITHYMEEVADADRLIVMKGGKVTLDGSPQEIFSHVEELRECGLTVPQVTLLGYEIRKKGVPLPAGILSVDEFVTVYKKVMDAKGRTNRMPFAPKKTEQSGDALTAEVRLEAQGLCYTYQENTAHESKAVDNVDLVIRKGEFVGLAGHTGSGKSTLIQHLNGLLTPTEGRILYHGKDIREQKKSALKELRRRVGLVFQYPEYQLFEETVLKDVEFGPKNLGMKKEVARECAVEALKMVGISEEFYDMSPFELSGGQKRRVAIAGVLAMNPEVLILDEPTAGLDPVGRDDILDALDKLRRERGISIVLVSHSMEDLAERVDRLVVMDHGRKVFDDVPENVFSKVEKLEEIHLAAPQVSYVFEGLRKAGFDVPEGIITMDEAVDCLADGYLKD